MYEVILNRDILVRKPKCGPTEYKAFMRYRVNEKNFEILKANDAIQEFKLLEKPAIELEQLDLIPEQPEEAEQEEINPKKRSFIKKLVNKGV